MKPKDIREFYRHRYEQTCAQCNKVNAVFTQEDDGSEYHTQVYVLCECGEVVQFDLPVN